MRRAAGFPGAVRVRNLATAVSRELVTDAEGRFFATAAVGWRLRAAGDARSVPPAGADRSSE